MTNTLPYRIQSQSLGFAQRPLIFLGVILLGCASILLLGYIFIDNRAYFFLVLSIIAIYIFLECAWHLRKESHFNLLAPPLLATGLYFFSSHVFSGVASIFDPFIYEQFSYELGSVWEMLSRITFAIGLSAFCMWRGFELSQGAGNAIRRFLMSTSVLRPELEARLMPVLIVQIVSILMVLYAISIDVFGFVGRQTARDELSGIIQILNFGSSAGTLSLFLLLLEFFRRRQRGTANLALVVFCIGAFALQLAFGVISGFKMQMVIPFIALGVAHFIASGKIPLGYVVVIGVALVLSYSVIEPYRSHASAVRNYEGAQSASPVDTFIESFGRQAGYTARNMPVVTQIAMRTDLNAMTAIGFAFADGGYVGDEEIEKLRASIYLSPILAFVPRAVWPEKPSFSTGVWFNQNVLGRVYDDLTSVGMGPIAFLYMAGGWFGIVVGFLGIGYFQGLMFHGVARSGGGGLLIYLALALTLAGIPTDLGAMLQGIFQQLPFLFVAQYFLLVSRR